MLNLSVIPLCLLLHLSLVVAYKNNGLDDYAVPSIIIGGTVKGGTTYLWHTIRTLDAHFHVKDRKKRDFGIEKEFNIAYRSDRYLYDDSIECPSEVMRDMMRCPSNVARKEKVHVVEGEDGDELVPYFVDDYRSCHHWIKSVSMKRKSLFYTNTKVQRMTVPKYTIDAYPYLMRNSETEMPSITTLNARNARCRHSSIYSKKPLMIVLIRHPLNRIESYYKYFLLGRLMKTAMEDQGITDLSMIITKPSTSKDKATTNIETDDTVALVNQARKQDNKKYEGQHILNVNAMVNMELDLINKQYMNSKSAYHLYLKSVTDFIQTITQNIDGNDDKIDNNNTSSSNVYRMSYKNMTMEARHVIRRYEAWKREHLRQLIKDQEKYSHHKFDDQGLLLDGLYLPQILSLIYPVRTVDVLTYGEEVIPGDPTSRVVKKDKQTRLASYPLLVIQSEFFYKYTIHTYRNHIVPFLYPTLNEGFSAEFKKTVDTTATIEDRLFLSDHRINSTIMMERNARRRHGLKREGDRDGNVMAREFEEKLQSLHEQDAVLLNDLMRNSGKYSNSIDNDPERQSDEEEIQYERMGADNNGKEKWSEYMEATKLNGFTEMRLHKFYKVHNQYLMTVLKWLESDERIEMAPSIQDEGAVNKWYGTDGAGWSL